MVGDGKYFGFSKMYRPTLFFFNKKTNRRVNNIFTKSTFTNLKTIFKYCLWLYGTAAKNGPVLFVFEDIFVFYFRIDNFPVIVIRFRSYSETVCFQSNQLRTLFIKILLKKHPQFRVNASSKHVIQPANKKS